MRIDDLQSLRALYGEASKRALQKQLTCLEKHSLSFLSLSPFAVISTCGLNGEVDSSPRGGEPGFVRIISNHKIALSDARGNNRLDTLSNIVETGKVGCLFLIPGVDETLRINGSAYISIDPDDLKYSSGDKNPAKSVIIIEIEDVYLHCAKSLMRSKLWLPDSIQSRKVLPSMGKMIAEQTADTSTDVETQEQMLSRYQQQL